MSSPNQPGSSYRESSNWYPPSQPGKEPPAPAGDVLVVGEPRRRLGLAWVIPGVALAVLLVFAAGWIGGTAYTKHAATSPDSDVLASAQKACDPTMHGTVVADEGHTLTVDGQGTKALLSGGGVDTAGLACLLDALKVPQAVRSHMEQTRALDGRQSDTWQGFTASWTYHPEQGLDVVVQVA